MAERIGKEKIDREDGYLYFLGKDGYVWRTPMKTHSRGRKGNLLASNPNSNARTVEK